jgi:hypothetical protein
VTDKAFEIDASEVGKKMTLNVHIRGMRRFKVRTFIAFALLRIVIWVAPFNVEVDSL